MPGNDDEALFLFLSLPMGASSNFGGVNWGEGDVGILWSGLIDFLN
jgi:hypothetical protein